MGRVSEARSGEATLPEGGDHDTRFSHFGAEEGRRGVPVGIGATTTTAAVEMPMSFSAGFQRNENKIIRRFNRARSTSAAAI